MARRGGGGGGGLVSRHQGGSQPVTTQPKLPGRGGGGGPGRPNQGGMNPHQRRNLRQDRRQDRRDAAAAAGGGSVTPALTTGIGSTAMNDIDTAQQGAMGLMNNLSPGGNVFQNSQQQMFANEQIGNLYNQYQGYQTANPGLENFTWSQYLGQQYGAGTEGQGLLNAIRAEWAKNQAKLRGGIAQGYYGSGRTITG